MRPPVRLFMAWFANEEELLGATHAARTAGLDIHDVFTPYAVHGIDEAMGLKPSRLTWVCLAMGLLGLVCALALQDWTSAFAWPLIVGGKPYHSLPAFIPVAFELTVLFAALGTVAALLVRARLFPRVRPGLLPDGVTGDAFVLALKVSGDLELMRSLSRRFNAERHAVVEVAK